MDELIKKELYCKLKDEKLKINWNKNPIKMDLFLSFLTIPYTRSHDHLGACNGWTRLENDQHNLEINGGVVNGVEYLDSIQYGNRLSNPYNNYVNPFFMFDVLNNEGKKFFFEYYKLEIAEIISEKKDSISSLEQMINDERRILILLCSEVKKLDQPL